MVNSLESLKRFFNRKLSKNQLESFYCELFEHDWKYVDLIHETDIEIWVCQKCGKQKNKRRKITKGVFYKRVKIGKEKVIYENKKVKDKYPVKGK